MEKELELIKEVKEHQSDEALKELIQLHSPLCYNIFKRYQPTIVASGACFQDICQEKDMVLYQAVMSYDPTLNTKFTTWLGNNIRYHCLSVIGSENKELNNKEWLVDYYPDIDPQIEKKEITDTTEYIFSILREMKDERISKVFEHRYLTGEVAPWHFVADKVGLSIQTAINLHEKGRKFLKGKLNSGKFLEFV